MSRSTYTECDACGSRNLNPPNGTWILRLDKFNEALRENESNITIEDICPPCMKDLKCLLADFTTGNEPVEKDK